MSLYGKSALDLFKEIAQCPPDILPPYNVSWSIMVIKEPPHTELEDATGRASEGGADRSARTPEATGHSVCVSDLAVAYRIQMRACFPSTAFCCNKYNELFFVSGQQKRRHTKLA